MSVEIKHVYTVRVFQMAETPDQGEPTLKFRKILARIKEDRGFTLRELANMAGVHPEILERHLWM
ncbi:MAG: hypothetical protein HYW49_02965 [Deltaproteobacteria bacterium]|nr:hypothetical protein [Deltaproteobacteria bacterium]